MAIKLTGNPISPYVRRVAQVLYEKKVSFELVVPKEGQMKSAEHLKVQPFGQIPFLEDDGFVVYESRAISRYIALKYADQGTKLIPTVDIKAIAMFEQAAAIEQNNFDEFARAAVYEMSIKPRKGETPDKDVYDKHIATLSKKLDAYEVILGKQKYLAGDELTLADLFHLPFGSYLNKIAPDLIGSRPNVARWFKDISERESWLEFLDGAKSVSFPA